MKRKKIKTTIKTYVIKCPSKLWTEALNHVNKNTTINEWLVSLIRSWVKKHNPEFKYED